MMHVGLDLCRSRVDVCVVDERGARVMVTSAAPDAGGLEALVERLACRGTEPIRGRPRTS